MSTNGNKSVNSYAVVITPDLAAEWLDIFAYDGQRKPDPHRVTYYAKEMTAGKWLPGRSIELAAVGSKKFLVDGQQRLWAVIEANQAQSFTVIEHPAHDMDEVAEIYVMIDIGKQRNASDILKPFHEAERTGLTTTHLNTLLAAARVLKAGFRSPTQGLLLSPREMPALMEDWAPHMRTFVETIEPLARDIAQCFRRAPVAAVAMYTLRWSPSKAPEFWRQVSQDDGLPIGDPRKTLRRFFAQHALGSKMVNSHQTLGVHTYCLYQALAWNAWLDGRSLSILKVVDPLADVVLKGTSRSELVHG